VQFKAIIFDLGDTLILTDQWKYDKCLMRLLESLQHENILVSTAYEEFKRVYFEVREQMYLEHESTLREVDFCERISKTLEKFNYKLNSKSPLLKKAIEAFFSAFIEDIRIEAYVPPLLAKLREKYKLGLVSNFAYPSGFWSTLHRFELTRFFDTIVVSGELGFRKPHQKIFEEALKKLDVKATETIFVGDSLKADIYGAKRLGMKTVFVENVGLRKNPYAIAGELDPFSVEPDVAIPSLQGLPKIIDVLQLS